MSEQQGQYGQYGSSRPTPGQPGQYGQYGNPPSQPQPGAPSGGQPGWSQGQNSWGQSQWAPAPGAPGGSGYGQYGPAQGSGAPAGFGGPPKPGIIPLRPLSVGEVLDGAFRAIRANPKATFGLSLLIMGVAALLTTVVTAAMTYAFALPAIDPLLTGGPFADPFGDPAASASQVGPALLALGLTLLISLLFTWIASTILTGLLMHSTSQAVIGRTASISEIWRLARGQLLRLFALTIVEAVILFTVYVVVIAAAAGAIGGAAVVLGDGPWSIVAILLLVFVAILAVVVVLGFFVIRLALATPSLMLERLGPLAAIKRGWQVSRKHFWRLLGILLLAGIIVAIISYAVAIPFSAAFMFVESAEALTILLLVQTAFSVLAMALTTPYFAAVTALAYIDLRMRKEGLDVTLAQSAEAQAGE
ncbi:glycerophosphoryl diester phosphodiesterase membrane domain-containing protein [Bogoriella caseilytica]|uniref:Glycerophosphoryl diester phosphodiesterase family protein n=1 Tax=Bogoriella caseilytica TaxID=56055 RepID=A0A3N2BEQ8_9MICO|nr:glycerophosphoryl diester phosphodiesterase membrane domain-containing protein [Bogoriella caseilytica]ROR73740.1 glycerophosphoryl diester phosphodiesterase family protein [Bogoriella caseilytica]